MGLHSEANVTGYICQEKLQYTQSCQECPQVNERCLEVVVELYPQAEMFFGSNISPTIKIPDVISSFSTWPPAINSRHVWSTWQNVRNNMTCT